MGGVVKSIGGGIGSAIGGAVGSLFKSGEQKIGASSAELQKVPVFTDEQETLLMNILNQVTGLQEDRQQRFPSYPGELSAPASPIQGQAFDLAGQLLGGNTFEKGIGTLEKLLSPFNERSERNRFNRLVAPYAEREQEKVLEQLLESFAGVGLDSGAARRAFADSQTDFNLGMNKNLFEYLNNKENLATNRNLNAINFGLGLPLNAGQALGATQRGIEQEGLNKELEEFVRTQQIDPLYGALLPVAFTKIFDTIANKGGTVVSPSPLTQIGGLLSGVASFFK